MPQEQDWRLVAELEDAAEAHGLLHHLRNAYTEAGEDARAGLTEDVAITHDGHRLFAYAGSQAALNPARESIAAACDQHGLRARYLVSRWDDELQRWRQVDPPEPAEQAERTHAQELEDETTETQTVVCNAGRTVRGALEQAMTKYADELGLEWKLVEHPHLLQTQVAFMLTGQRRKIAEFRAALEQEAWTTIRADSFGTGVI